MRVLTVSCLIMALVASAMARELQQSGDYYILLEDGTRMTYGDLRALSQNKVRIRCWCSAVGQYVTIIVQPGRLQPGLCSGLCLTCDGDAAALQCCFSVNFPFAVTYSSTNRIRFFISGTCDPTMEVRWARFRGC